MKTISTYGTFCKQISAHEPIHHLNGDESPRGNTRHVHARVFGILLTKIKNTAACHDVIRFRLIDRSRTDIYIYSFFCPQPETHILYNIKPWDTTILTVKMVVAWRQGICRYHNGVCRSAHITSAYIFIGLYWHIVSNIFKINTFTKVCF